MANRPFSLRMGGFFISVRQHAAAMGVLLKAKARHGDAVALVCLNTPSATLRSL